MTVCVGENVKESVSYAIHWWKYVCEQKYKNCHYQAYWPRNCSVTTYSLNQLLNTLEYVIHSGRHAGPVITSLEEPIGVVVTHPLHEHRISYYLRRRCLWGSRTLLVLSCQSCFLQQDKFSGVSRRTSKHYKSLFRLWKRWENWYRVNSFDLQGPVCPSL